MKVKKIIIKTDLSNIDNKQNYIITSFVDDKRYYENIQLLLNNEVTHFEMPEYNLKFNLVELINKYIKINGNKTNFIEYLLYEVSMENFFNKYKDEVYVINVDKKKYSVPIKEIINFLLISELDFKNIIITKRYLDIDISTFIYILVSFAEDYNIENRYDLPKFVSKRLYELKEHHIVDYFACNKILGYEEEITNKFNLNNSFMNSILNGMNNNYSLIEKSIYIYIKLCKALSYDEEFYLEVRNKEEYKHKNIANISNVSIKNNVILCYEFTYIYSKILTSLGINNSIVSKNISYPVVEHVFLNYRTEDFVVSADSVTSVLYGDLVKAKFNQPLKGLRVLNICYEKTNEFYEIVDRVYSDIKIQENYKKNIYDTNNMTIVEKFKLFLKEIKKLKFTGIELITCIFNLRDEMFSFEEIDNNVLLSIIKDNEPLNTRVYSELNLVILLDDEVSKEKCFILNSNGEYSKIDVNQLESLFLNQKIDYAPNNVQYISGNYYSRLRKNKNR